MSRGIIVFSPFTNDFTPLCGSSIRIAGYTEALIKHGVTFKFFSKNKPDYINNNQHIPCEINQKFIKLFVLHNIFYSNILLRPISIIIKILLNFIGAKKLQYIIKNSLIWTHQENALAFFYYLTQKVPFIYDVHGIFSIQQEYRSTLNRWRKLWFDIYKLHEKLVINKAPFINVVSMEMKEFVQNSYNPAGEILLAPDGVPANIEEYENTPANPTFKSDRSIPYDKKVILFAGSFKKIGGVSELAKTFVENSFIHNSAILVLIGNGQEEKNVQALISNKIIKERVFCINSMPHNELISYMKMANVIVCPDIASNRYNKITPHIKLYDAIATGKNVVATDFSVNKNLFSSERFNITYFSYQKNAPNSMSWAIIKALEKPNKKIENLKSYTYFSRCEEYLMKYKHIFFND